MNLNVTLKGAVDWFLGAPVRIILILLLALIAQRIATRAIRRALSKVAEADLVPGERIHLNRQRERARTASTVLQSTSRAIIGAVAGAMILSEMGINLGPLVASAGVIGFAVGLGSQTIVRDVFSGIIMLIEDQYGVGDDVDGDGLAAPVRLVGHARLELGGREPVQPGQKPVLIAIRSLWISVFQQIKPNHQRSTLR